AASTSTATLAPGQVPEHPPFGMSLRRPSAGPAPLLQVGRPGLIAFRLTRVLGPGPVGHGLGPVLGPGDPVLGSPPHPDGGKVVWCAQPPGVAGRGDSSSVRCCPTC